MDLEALRKEFEGCECGHKHDFDLEALEVAHGNLDRVAEILSAHNFPKKILMVADVNSFRVTKGLYEQLLSAG